MIDNSFRISADWLHATPAGERDIAHIRIDAGQETLTRVLERESGDLRPYLKASAITLAFWLADNWWRLRYETLSGSRPTHDWRLRHELPSVGGGSIWPPILFYGTGSRTVCAPAFGPRPSTGPIRFIEPETVHIMSAEVFESAVDQLLGNVLHNAAHAKDATALNQTIGVLLAERADPAVTAWRALEARLGFDPDDAPVELIEQLGRYEAVLGREAVEEAAAAVPGDNAAQILRLVVDASKSSPLRISLRAAHDVDISNLDPREPTWRWGEMAARRIRACLGISDGPFNDAAFSALLEAPWAQVQATPATAFKLPYSALLRADQDDAGVALKMRPRVHRRFELARVIGDAIWSKHQAFGVISRATTERQKFQRAFAQSLLCPFSEVRRYVDLEQPTDEQINRAASDLGVHRTVVETLLVHKNVLPRETLMERLEAA